MRLRSYLKEYEQDDGDNGDGGEKSSSQQQHEGLWIYGEVLQAADKYEQAVHQFQKAYEIFQEYGGSSNEEQKRKAKEKLQQSKV